MRKKHMRLCSLLLALVMVVSLLPVPAFAEEETQTYTKVTAADELTTGKYVLVADTGYAPNKLDGTWVTAIQPTIADDGTITDPTEGVWTLTVAGTSAKLTDVNGTSIAPSGGNNNGIKSGDYSWDVTFADGKFTFAGTGDDTVKFASNTSSQNKFRAYKNGTIAGKPNGYPCAFTLYKLVEDTEPARESGVVTDLTTLQDGDKVVVFNPANSKALSTTYSGFYNIGSDVTLTDGVLTYAETDVWTLAINEDGSYSFATSDGRKLSMDTGYTSMPLDKANSSWNITAVDGKTTVYIDNVGRAGFRVQYQTSYGTWSAYNNNTTGDSYEQQLYLVIEGNTPVEPEPEPEPDPEPTGAAYTLTDRIAAGDTVLMYNANSGTVLTSVSNGYKLAPLAVTPVENVITTDDTTAPWVVGVDEYGNYTFTQGDKVLGMVQSGSYVNLCTDASDGYKLWSLDHSTTPNVFYVLNTKMPAGTYGFYYIEYYNGGYTAYSIGSPSDAQFGISFYKLNTAEPEPEKPTISTIAAALAGENGTEFTVKGVVTLVDGKNIYLQDATGGICLRLNETPADISLGDTLIGTGSKTVYSGLPQLGSGTYEKSEGLTLSARNITIDALTTADICTYVSLKNVTVTEVYDNNGTYTAPNITVTDGTNSIQLYKAVIGKDSDGNWEYQVGDVLDITAAVGYFNKFQLRNTVASEVKKHVAVNYGKITAADQLLDGSYVMVVSTGYAPLAYDSGWLSTVQPVIENDKVTASQGAVWTLKVEGNTVTLTDKNGVAIKPKGGNNNGISSGEYSWSWTFNADNQTFKFLGVDSDTVTLASNNNMDPTYGGFNKFRAYKNTTVASQGYPCEFTLYSVDPAAADDPVTPVEGIPANGDKVVIYNQNAGAVLARQNDNVDSPAINKALATITDGVATAIENGGVVFTVETNGDYLRFKNETYGYLCSNGTGNNAFYSKEASEDADWLVRTCSGGVGGFEMESRTAKFNGRYSQWLEYYSDSFKTYSMYNVTDYTIYSFYFYPVGTDVKLQGGVVNDPKVVFTSADTAMKGQDYTLTFYLDDINTIASSSIQAKDFNGNVFEIEATADGYSALIPASYLVGNVIIFEVEIEDDGGKAAYSGSLSVTIVDEPSIGAVTPAASSQTGADKRPTISAEIVNAGENPTLTMTVNDQPVEATYADGKLTYVPAEDMSDGTVSVTVTVKRADGKTASKSWNFIVGTSQFQLFFGQLHSHTQYSDGSGKLEDALSYVENLPASANVQFVSFTDHSNYFDGSKTSAGTANPEGALYDMSLASSDSQNLWNSYKSAVAAFNEKNAGSVLALAGFEMTWSGGPGHINTFNTPGIVSRNNTTLNSKTDDAGLKAYYALLSQPEGADSINQFNHPGTTFGNFVDFAYWDPVIDSRMHLVEVGNGEGQIGQGGYYPSFEQYTMALDKGWHVAPSINQDNHKGRWGNANDGRNVILAETLSEEGVYDAIRALRMYASEDKNLQLSYTVNGQQLGSIINEVPEKLDVAVSVFDPDSSDSIARVELIVNTGLVAHTWSNAEELASGVLTATLAPEYTYYYVRVTQSDGDLAVTAPVWVGESLKLGINEVTCSSELPITGETLTISTTLYNSEAEDAVLKSMTYRVGETVLGTDTTEKTLAAGTTTTVDFTYVPTAARVMTVTVEAIIEQGDKQYTFTKDIELDITDSNAIVYLGIDGAHYNEYVAGNYSDSMGTFSNLAAGYQVQTVVLSTSDELIAACGNEKFVALLLTAPSRRLEAAKTDPRTYSDAEIAAIKAFNERGGAVILAGWSDYYETYGTYPADKHMAATQNAVLEALGSCLRISDDATYDDELHGSDGSYRLYFNTYNFNNSLNEGVVVDAAHNYDRAYTELFSHYGGASIYTVDGTLPGSVSPVVYGHASTYSKDCDNDGLGGSSVPKYAYAEGDERLMVMATEQLDGKGLIVVSGAAFLSNFELQSGSAGQLGYSNCKIAENLLKMLKPVTITPIGTVNKITEPGYKFTIEGVVTANASGFDPDTAFFDCTYVQDSTGGINVFPVAGSYKIGDVVRITGTTSSYQGENQLNVTSIEIVGESSVEPTAVTAEQVNDGSVTGLLVTVEGTATHIEYANGLVQTIMVRDENGDETRVFIDGYITTAKDVENLVEGCHVVATGLASYDNTFALEDGTYFAPRIRIRNRADVVCSEETNVRQAYTVTFVTNGGTIHSGVIRHYFPGMSVTLPTNVTREGFTFLGWYTAEGVRVTAIGAGETGPKTFYAYWQENVTEPVETELPFVDVDENDWFYDDVKYVYENGLMIGTDTLHFSPDATLDRAQLVTILYRMAGKPTGAAACAFADVQRGEWYTDAVDWAVANGIVMGYDNGLFGTADPVTREQLATMLFRYAVYCGMDFVTLAEHLGGFADTDAISPYAVPAFNWAVGAGLIRGTDDDRLLPGENASRAQIAAIIHRYLSALEG